MQRMVRAAGVLLVVLAVMANCRPAAAVAEETNTATIVIPESALPVVKLAATELQEYVEKATGTKMPIVKEGSAPQAGRRIYLGATAAAVKAGINPGSLPRDAYRIQKAGEVSYLVGGDRDGDPLSLGTPAGTLFAVYDVLDNDLGVRWLWPGKSGEFVPKRSAFNVKDRAETVLPRFRFCGLRTSRPEELRWQRRMRMHDADGLNYGHAFEAWGKKYFAEHPDWFEMNDKGVRVPGKSMCVSNPGFQKQIVENWWAECQKHPGEKRNVNICENDGPGACCCPNCRAWDGAELPWPRPVPYEAAHNVSRRYARFEMEVLKLARQHDPKAEVTAYAYSNLTFAPSGVQMDKGALIGYVPDVFFPRTAEDHAWVLRHWDGWEATSASMFLRPNYLLNGYCMPANWARQWADEFQHFEKHGLVGSDFDSLTGQWSMMGLTLYAVGRLHVKPQMPVDELLGEYYAAFGPAAKQVQAYWEYWERYNQEHIDLLQDGVFQYARYPEHIAKRFPPEAFVPAEKLMAEAEQAASKDADAAAKVSFLKVGLQHAKLCVEASMAFDKAGQDQEMRKAAVAKLLDFRKTITDPMAVNLSDGDSSCKGLETNLEWPE